MLKSTISAKTRRTLYGILALGAAFGAYATTSTAPGLLKVSSEETTDNDNTNDADTPEVKLQVPGTFKAGDLDATEGTYYHKQFTENKGTDKQLKNDYKDNPNVEVRITGDGVIGNTSENDFFTYTFDCKDAGRYTVTAYVSNGSGESKYSLTFDKDKQNEKVFTQTFQGAGWDTYVESVTTKVDLTAGVHTMRFTVLKGLNVKEFKFERTGDLPIQIDDAKIKNYISGSFLGGDMDDEEGSYYNKQFVAEGSTLKNDYKGNPGVKVRINGNGVVGNTTDGDFFTYYFNADKDGDYNLIVTCEASTNSTGKFTLAFDNGEAKEYSFTGEGWGTQVAVPVGKINFEGGNHKMVFTVVSGLNLAKFEFNREKTEADVRYTLPCDEMIAGMLDTDRGSYFHKNFNDGDNKYAANSEVKVDLDGNGKIGDTSKGDYYTYTIKCEEEADYEVFVTVKGAPIDKEKEVKFTFHSENEQSVTAKFKAQGWDSAMVETKAEGSVHLGAGIHTMKVELVNDGAVDLKFYKVTKAATTPTGIEAIQNGVNTNVNVYSIDGRYLRKADSVRNALDGLAPGIYIVAGKKYIKK